MPGYQQDGASANVHPGIRKEFADVHPGIQKEFADGYLQGVIHRMIINPSVVGQSKVRLSSQTALYGRESEAGAFPNESRYDHDHDHRNQESITKTATNWKVPRDGTMESTSSRNETESSTTTEILHEETDSTRMPGEGLHSGEDVHTTKKRSTQLKPGCSFYAPINTFLVPMRSHTGPTLAAHLPGHFPFLPFYGLNSGRSCPSLLQKGSSNVERSMSATLHRQYERNSILKYPKSFRNHPESICSSFPSHGGSFASEGGLVFSAESSTINLNVCADEPDIFDVPSAYPYQPDNQERGLRVVTRVRSSPSSSPPKNGPSGHSSLQRKYYKSRRKHSDTEASAQEKLERKRAQNRVAAKKCYNKKLEKIVTSEMMVKHLEGIIRVNDRRLSELGGEVEAIKSVIRAHIQAGCISEDKLKDVNGPMSSLPTISSLSF